jgi:hypothetical protein
MTTTFPLLFGREGGLEADVLRSLTMQNSVNAIQEITSIKTFYSNKKESIVEILFDLIGIELNETNRKMLLSLKRDIYNHRDVLKYNKLTPGYPILHYKLKEFSSQSAEIINLEEQFRQIFENELTDNIDKLRNALTGNTLSNGIMFSSGFLFDELKKSRLPFSGINKSDRDLILTVTKYFTRSASKTTPFSSLNRIFLLELKDGNFTGVNFSNRESRMQVSNLIYFRIKELLLSNNNFITCLELQSNPAIFSDTKEDEYIHFFLNKNNNEFLKRINRTEVISGILELLKQAVTYGELTNHISSKFSQSAAAADEYLSGLVELGIVNIKYPAGLNDMDWVSTLINFIDSRNLDSDERIQNVRQFLLDLRSTSHCLESISDVAERRRHIERCSESLTTNLNPDRRHSYLNKLADSGNLFYENVFKSTDIKLKGDVVDAAQTKIQEVYFALNSNFLKKRSRNMLAQCITRAGIRRIPLLRAYEEFYLGNEISSEAEGPEFDRISNLVNQVLTALNERNSDCPVDISRFFNPAEITIDNNVRFGAFVQALDPELNDLIINSFSGGFGSNISRYLGFCPPHIVDRFREYANHFEEDLIIADTRDASIHNAGSFPVLSQHTLDIASSTDCDFGETLATGSLYLSLTDFDDVIICNASGKRVYPVNFSMEAIARKSRFMQFLDLFNNTELFGYQYFIQRINDFLIGLTLKENVVVSPRIVFKEKVTLKRKQWHIKTGFLQSWIGNYNGLAHLFCIKINEFLLLHSIPSTVFVRFGYSPGAGKMRDDHNKPQYIDFMSPVLILLFINMLSKSGNVIEFSEILPDFTTNKDPASPFVKEYVMNF